MHMGPEDVSKTPQPITPFYFKEKEKHEFLHIDPALNKTVQILGEASESSIKYIWNKSERM